MLLILRLKINKFFWLSLLTIFLIFGFGLTALATINHKKTVVGLTLAGLEISGINNNQIEKFLKSQAEKFGRKKIAFIYGDHQWLLSPDDLGVNLEAEIMASVALAFGHDSLLAAVAQQIESLLIKKDLSLSYSVNLTTLNQALEVFADVQVPAQNASLKYDSQENDFVIEPARKGITVNRVKLVEDTLKTFSDQTPQAVYLSLTDENPKITEHEINQVMEEAQQLLNNAPYFLQSENATWPINKAELAGWVSSATPEDDPKKAKLSLNTDQINEFLVPLVSSINREPTDAKLTSSNGELKFAVLAQDGQKLNIEASAQKIAQEILAGKKNIYLITDVVEPQISNQNTQELGLLTLLGKGNSDFSGSPTNRRLNIKTGATKLNGFLIRPGEEFSFSQNIGEIDAQNGWLPELVIKNKQTIPEFGGGLCQVSTTLFRAAVNAGLKITERHPHAYPVRYYNPPGFDATVYPPSPDLKFLNDTPGHLLLQTKIEGNKLFFEIYGTNDGREVKIKGPTTTQKNPDGSLKTILTQEIWRDGQIERQSVFRSSYNSPALYPVATASPTPTPAPSPAQAPEGAPSPAASPTQTPPPTTSPTSTN